MTHRSPRDCEIELERGYPSHAQAADGERWTCSCGRVYEHVCDEAEGCSWEPGARSTSAAAHNREETQMNELELNGEMLTTKPLEPRSEHIDVKFIGGPWDGQVRPLPIWATIWSVPREENRKVGDVYHFESGALRDSDGCFLGAVFVHMGTFPL